MPQTIQSRFHESQHAIITRAKWKSALLSPQWSKETPNIATELLQPMQIQPMPIATPAPQPKLSVIPPMPVPHTDSFSVAMDSTSHGPLPPISTFRNFFRPIPQVACYDYDKVAAVLCNHPRYRTADSEIFSDSICWNNLFLANISFIKHSEQCRPGGWAGALIAFGLCLACRNNTFGFNYCDCC